MQPRLEASQYALLHEDIFFCLILLLKPHDIFALRLVSKYYLKQIENKFADNYFCQAYAKTQLLFTSEQIEGVNIYQLIKKRYCIKQIIQNDFANNKYLRQGVKFFLFNTYKFGVRGERFNINELIPFLNKDDAAGLFTRISRFKKMIPYFMSEQINEHIFFNSLACIEENDGIKFIFGDVFFMGLLSIIMQIRAVNCFNLFIRAYLILNRFYWQDLLKVEVLKFEGICQKIFLHQDKYFIQSFINISFDVFNYNHLAPVLLVKYALDNQYEEELVNKLHKIDENNLLKLIVNCEHHNINLEEVLKKEVAESDYLQKLKKI